MSDIDTINENALREASAIEAWKGVYVASHPMPEQKKINLFQEFGLEFIFALVTTISSLLLAAMRTGFQFFMAAFVTANRYLTASVFQQTLPDGAIFAFSLVEMLAAVAGIDGILVVFGLARGRRRGIQTVPIAGVVIALVISIAAGLGQSLGIITTNLQWLDGIIAIVTGVGASLVAYYSAEALGALWNRIDSAQENYHLKYDREVQEWYTKMGEEFRGNNRRRIIGVAEKPQEQKVAYQVPQPNNNGYHHGDLTNGIIRWLEEHEITPQQVGEVVAPIDIARELGVDPAKTRVIISRLRERGENWRGK